MILTPVANMSGGTRTPDDTASYAFIDDVSYSRTNYVHAVIDEFDFYEENEAVINIDNNGVNIEVTYELNANDVSNLGSGSLELTLKVFNGADSSAMQIGTTQYNTRSATGTMTVSAHVGQAQITTNAHIEVKLSNI